jgi:hypothetical protein
MGADQLDPPFVEYDATTFVTDAPGTPAATAVQISYIRPK